VTFESFIYIFLFTVLEKIISQFFHLLLDFLQSFSLSIYKYAFFTIKMGEKVTVFSTFLKSSLNFLSNNLKKTVEKLVQWKREAVSQFELPETQFERTVRDKIACKTHL